MYAIISELDSESTAAIRDYWQRLCKSCGLKEIYNLPTPHFTWLLAEGLDIDRIALLIDQIAVLRDPLAIQTFGLGIFSGNAPVLYLPIVKTGPLLQLHRDIWDRIQPLCVDVHRYYAPSSWIPHITLALKDLTSETITCAIAEIAFESIELTGTAERLALVAYKNGQKGETLRVASFNLGQE